MTTSLRFACFSLALCLASSAHAGAPGAASDFDQVVGGANEIWYLSGDHEESDTSDPELTVQILTHVDTSGSGAVSGSGSFNLTGLLEGNLPLVISGQMGGTAAKPVGKVAYSFSGPATLDAQGVLVDGIVSGSGKATCRNPLPHDPELFSCRGGLRLCFEAMLGGRTRRICQGGGGLEIPLHAGGGPWTLAMDLMTDPNGVVTGSATTTLANAASEDHLVTGRYKAKNDQSVLKFTSADPLIKPALKNRVSITDQLIQRGITRSNIVVFKVAGETGRIVTMTPVGP